MTTHWRRRKKKAENFGTKDGRVDCSDFPRCAGCTELDHCDECDEPLCVWECGGKFSTEAADEGLFCKQCRLVILAGVAHSGALVLRRIAEKELSSWEHWCNR